MSRITFRLFLLQLFIIIGVHAEASSSGSSAAPSVTISPGIKLRAPNWTYIEDSGLRQRFGYTAYGLTDKQGNFFERSLEFGMNGKDYWLEAFTVNIIKEEGEWLGWDRWGKESTLNATINTVVHVSSSSALYWIS